MYVDGRDVRTYDRAALRKKFGTVFQNDIIFAETLADNITLGRDLSREAVRQAAEDAMAAGFIAEKPGQYGYAADIRGANLSGGQKQRISIARVFLKNPPIIILDEATSALDNESEFAVAKSLARLSEGRTTLTIAHRLSSIRNSDRILVLTEKGIAEEGNHEELLEKRGIYYQFYTMANELK